MAPDPTDAQPRAAMFFAGLILLIPHRIGMSRVNYVIKRYNLPISRAGLLLYKFHNPIEVSLFIGNVLGVIIVAIIAGTIGDATQTAKDNNRGALKGCMIGVCSAMLLSSIFMFIIYVSGDDYGHLDLFYFSLILITFFDGFTNAFAFGCNPTNASLYALGIPISGALVSILHNICKLFSDGHHWQDFDYYVLKLQLIINILTILTTIIVWIPVGHTEDGSGNSQLTPAKNGSLQELFSDANNSGHALDWSPIGMLAISLGTVYAFYPSIAPYSIIDYQYASVIELWILLISSSPTVLMAALDLADKGPGDVVKNWHPTNTSGRKWYNLIWLCVIIYILCIQIFMSMLHYPDSLLSSFFNHPYIIGFISVLFNTLRECMQACGFAGAGKQVNKSTPTTSDINGTIAAINKPITLFVMMFCVFTGDGYLQHYRRCCRDCWSTTGYTKGQSFRYWLRYGFKGGSKSFTTSFTSPVKTQISPVVCQTSLMFEGNNKLHG